jgi:branched-chain amino acid transport system substrate-binding protein
MKRLACLLVFLLPFSAFAQLNSPIEIAAVFNTTGRQAPLGISSLQGAQLAVDQINQKQAVLGRPLKLMVKNGQTDPEALAKIGEEIANNPKITLATGLSDNNMVLVIAPIVTAAGKLFITTGATSPLLPLVIRGHFFMACFGDNTQAAAGADYAYKHLKIKTVAVLYDDGMDYTKGLQKYFTQTFKSLGGKVIYKAYFSHAHPSLAKQLNAIKKLKKMPQMIYLAAGPTEAPALIKAIRKVHPNVPIMGGDGYVAKVIIKESGKAANNIYYTTHAYFAKNKGNKKIRAFVNAYLKKYQQMPTAYSGLAYDTINIFKDAIIKAGSTSANAVSKALESMPDFVGVTGKIDYDPDLHLPKKTVSVVKIENGEASLVDQVEPKNVPVAKL